MGVERREDNRRKRRKEEWGCYKTEMKIKYSEREFISILY